MSKRNRFNPSPMERARQGGSTSISQKKNYSSVRAPRFKPSLGTRVVRADACGATFSNSTSHDDGTPRIGFFIDNPNNVDPKTLLPKEPTLGMTLVQIPQKKEKNVVYRYDVATYRYENNEWRLVPDPRRPWYTGKGGACYRTGCKCEESAEFYNNGTREYYCFSCALDIQRANNGQSFVLFKEIHDAINHVEGAPDLRTLRKQSLQYKSYFGDE